MNEAKNGSKEKNLNAQRHVEKVTKGLVQTSSGGEFKKRAAVLTKGEKKRKQERKHGHQECEENIECREKS